MTSIFLLLLGIFACGEKEAPEVLPPSGLSVELTTNKGAVMVTASAQNANFYKFYFGETEGEIPLRVNDGQAQYTYSESGDYTVRVQAHTTEAVFVSEERQVSITLDNEWEVPEAGYSTPDNYEGWDLVWQDEFDGDALNTSDWTYEIGTGAGGWGNNEWQYYRENNTSVRDGYLIIEARKEAFGGQDYTSSRIITKGNQEFQYGRIDIRAALPQGQGIWPALWMLGANISSVGWPSCGEIDIMEMIGGSNREKTVHGTLHWDNGGHNYFGGDYSLTSGAFSDEFHVFTIIWNAESITWLVNDEEFHSHDITSAELSEFHNDFFLIFNLAVGGNWPGYPDETTSFPQRLTVDYVRVFQKQ